VTGQYFTFPYEIFDPFLFKKLRITKKYVFFSKLFYQNEFFFCTQLSSSTKFTTCLYYQLLVFKLTTARETTSWHLVRLRVVNLTPFNPIRLGSETLMQQMSHAASVAFESYQMPSFAR